jgi:hypothetical protein
LPKRITQSCLCWVPLKFCGMFDVTHYMAKKGNVESWKGNNPSEWPFATTFPNPPHPHWFPSPQSRPMVEYAPRLRLHPHPVVAVEHRTTCCTVPGTTYSAPRSAVSDARVKLSWQSSWILGSRLRWARPWVAMWTLRCANGAGVTSQ